MPYIAPRLRRELDPLIDALAERLAAQSQAAGSDGAFTGLLNYACTRLALALIRRRFGRLRYWLIAAVTGVFHNVAAEFYRRVAVPYEDVQMAKSGDVDLFEEFTRDLEKHISQAKRAIQERERGLAPCPKHLPYSHDRLSRPSERNR